MADVLDIDNAEDFEVDDDGDRKCEITVIQSNEPNPILMITTIQKRIKN